MAMRGQLQAYVQPYKDWVVVDKIAPETTPEHEPEIPQRYAGRSTGVEIATIAIIRNARTPERQFDVLAAGAANYPVCVDWRKHTAYRTPSSTVTSAPPAAPR